MSNAEMPPLAAGQVWVNETYTVLIGGELSTESGPTSLWKPDSRRYIWANADFMPLEALSSSNGALRLMLAGDNTVGQPFRLIHGPGAPWSPEETSHA